jgi:endonuclease III
MATTTNKQRLLSHFFGLLKRSVIAEPDSREAGTRPVLEQFLYGVCRENATREQADLAFKNLRERFFDWNEIRVSSPRELEEALGDLPDAEQRAERIISFLQQVFEKEFSFDLESFHKKGVKQAAKALAGYQASNDYVIAWVLRNSLGGHAIPLDAPTLRVTRRLGLIDRDQEDRETLRTSLEHLIPKAKGAAFTEVASHIAHECCWEEEPSCSVCPLAGDCPTAQELGAEVLSTARTTRNKPR